MLIVSRRDAESILIRPGDGIDPSMTLADLFARTGPIEITIFSSNNNRVKMGVQAPERAVASGARMPRAPESGNGLSHTVRQPFAEQHRYATADGRHRIRKRITDEDIPRHLCCP